ncbi:MAG: EAL domain-containing protein [Rhodoferax sp.]|nr:EAL domain-containing protein [Rhodoferax sp.]
MSKAVEGRVLGQLLRMQSCLLGLSDAELVPFVIRELADVPGVGHIEFAAVEQGDQGHGIHYRLASGAQFHGELIFGLTDATAFAPYADPVRGCVSMLTHILEERRQRAAVDRHASDLEQQYLAIVGVMVMALDRDGRIAMINKKGAQLLGCAESALLGTDWFENFLPADERDSVRRVFDTLMLGQTQLLEHHENYIVNASGQKLILAWNNSLLHDEAGQVVGTLSCAEDITERRAVEQDRLAAQNALRDSEARMRLFFDNVPVGIFVSTRAGKFVYVNAALPRILGYDSPEELITVVNRSSIAEAVYVEPGRRQQVIQAFDRSQERWHCTENRYRRKDGEVIDAILSLGEQYDSATAELRYFGVITDISEGKRMEGELTESREKFRGLSEAAFEAIFISEKGRCLEQNQRAEQMFGYSAQEALGRPGTDWIAPADRELVIKNMMSGYELPYEVTALRKDGSTFPATIRGKGMQYKDRVVRVTSLSDITERKQAQDEILRERDFSRAALDSLPGLFYLIDQQGQFLRWNQNFETVSGYDSAEISRLSPLDFFDADEQAPVAAAIERVYEQGEAQVEAWFLTKNRAKIPFLFNGKRCLFDGKPCLMGMGIDITERKRADERIEHLAFYDPLTNLPNRRLLLDRLEQAISSSTRHVRHGALMLLDMDDFKTLNDTLGHDVGDQFLVEVASRLQASVREGDTVARHGGDEFVVILEDLSEGALAVVQAESVAVKILKAVSQPYVLDLTIADGQNHTRAYHGTSSIGITLFLGSAVSVDELMRRADTAMYQAKAAGRNALRFFDPEMQSAVTARAALDNDLRDAVREGQFVLYYQPQVDVDARYTGAEALLRWQHPRRGLVPPAEFIAHAEATGLIVAIGQWVLETACAQLVIWATQPRASHLTLAVNVSARQFRDVDFVEQILAIVRRTGVNPRKLKLELTESVLLEQVEDTIAKMTALQAAGIGFALDDFGTGYSSLSYLQRLPLDQLKIDQSFVRDVLTDPNDAAIARTIVALAHSMGLAVIAEGVETQAQREFLAANGCMAYQGYLFGRPAPIQNFRW